MPVNLPTLTLCLLCTAILCRATSPAPPTDTILDPTSGLTSDPTSSPASTLEYTTTQAGATATDPTSTHSVSNETTSVSTSQPMGEGSSEDFSPGEIAAITIGTIAGVAAVGGSVFAALKFTGKL